MKKEQRSAKLKQRTAKPGEVYAFYVEMLGKYGACQILAVDGKSICYVLLDYLEDDLPEKTAWSGYNRIIGNPFDITVR